MLMTRWVVSAVLISTLGWGMRAADVDAESIIELKLAIKDAGGTAKDIFMREGSDPVADLYADITLINKTETEKVAKDKVPIEEVARFTSDELIGLKKLTREQQLELLAKKKETRDVEVLPVNGKSLGYAYVEPQLGAADSIEFLIIKLPDEGETVPEGAMPAIVSRDNLSDQATAADAVPQKYLAAGETSPVYKIPIGKFYVIRRPGMYSVRAIMRGIGDKKAVSPFESSKFDNLIRKYPGGVAISNEEKFRVLPFKVVEQTIAELKSSVELYERGYPDFNYMIYQVRADANYDEIYALQRILVRNQDSWEWTRLGSVKSGTTAQVAQMTPAKVALLVVHAKGDAGLYELDFSQPGVKINIKPVPAKDGAAPKLKVEGGTISVE